MPNTCRLVVACYFPQRLFGGNIAFIRLLRLMRLFKLVKKVKKLNAIVMGLYRGLGSVAPIAILCLLIFYLFAVLGVATFRRNDPYHFGGVGVAMITLFRVATLDNWSPILLIDWFGCASQNSSVIGVRRLI